MKKETVIAVLLGIGAGVLIALWVIKGVQTKDNSKQLIEQEKITPSISISNAIAEPLLVSSPEDGFVSNKEIITIQGKSKKGTLVIIQTPLAEFALDLDSNEFSQEITLMEGENNITVTSYNKKEIESRSLLIYYVSAE